MAERPILKESLFLLNICGANPLKLNKLDRVLFTLCVILATTVTFELCLECFLHWNGLDSIEALSLLVAVYEFDVKLYSFFKTRKRLASVLNKMKDFWPSDKYSDKLKKDVQEAYKYTKMFAIYMLFSIFILFVIYISQALLAHPRKFMYNTYHPKDTTKSPDYELTFIYQICFAISANILLFGYDGLFVGLIMNISFEFKIIRWRFDNISLSNEDVKEDSIKEKLRKLYEIVNHHSLVLGCIKDVRNIYSMMLLNVFGFNMLTVCTSLLGIIVTGFPPTIESLTRYGPFAGFFLMQLFFYCIAGNYLVGESEQVSFAVYNTNWWIRTQPELRRTCVMIIQRANKIEELTAGEMFPLNLDSFRMVVRSSLSFFTLVKALYYKTN